LPAVHTQLLPLPSQLCLRGGSRAGGVVRASSWVHAVGCRSAPGQFGALTVAGFDAQWGAEVSQNWDKLEGADAGQTHVDHPEEGEMAVWAHPVDLHYVCKVRPRVLHGCHTVAQLHRRTPTRVSSVSWGGSHGRLAVRGRPLDTRRADGAVCCGRG
jgi:hypothetical protein